MTRDIPGAGEARVRDTFGDNDLTSALWSATSFTTLPDDAPEELKDLTVDIDDPHRVYAIFRASRRHDFQILVEKYIIQLRYGCHEKLCTIPTCFSCRRRLAGSRPIRRYNPTSARMLAVHLASQDNPEQGLCHSPSADPKRSQALTTTISPREVSRTPARETPIVPLSPRKVKMVDIAPRRLAERQRPEETGREHKYSAAQPRSKMQLVDETTTTDHRSFVQNMFGTVAFKMLDWLSPRNLDIMTRPEASAVPAKQKPITERDEPTYDEAERSSGLRTKVFEENEVNGRAKGSDRRSIDKRNGPQSKIQHPDEDKARRRSHSQAMAKPPKKASSDGKHKSTTQKPRSTSLPKQGPPAIQKPEAEEVKQPKDILNLTSSHKGMNGSADMKPHRTSVIDIPRSTSPPRTVLTDHKTQLAERTVEETMSVISTNSSESPEDCTTRTMPVQKLPAGQNLGQTPQEASVDLRALKHRSAPQSLSRLTIEVINFICDILQNDDTIEKHSLHPTKITQTFKYCTDRPTPRLDGKHSVSFKQQWRCFIEQSLFDILRRPDSLLESFSDDNGQPLDTQILYYLMLRLTRVAPSIVFDSLWTVSGSLFKPPDKVEGFGDSSKSAKGQALVKTISSIDAARVLNVALHALVAAAPLVTDYHHMSAMSRVGSYGRFILDGDSNILPSSALSLQYEDVFSNDLALRLARRVFACVPTRRRYAELLELQRDVATSTVQEPDILQFVLKSLEAMDLQPPDSHFTQAERTTHRIRFPLLIIDWARNVMLQEWDGSPKVPNDGPFGGALATIAAIHQKRKSFLLVDMHFRTEYFAERLDAVGMPAEWLTFEPSKRTVHLLDFPWLFNPSTLISYFRAINYSRMNQAFEASKQMQQLIRRHADRSLVTPAHSYFKLYDRLFTATAGYFVLDIRRTHLLEDTFNSIWRREERELLRPLKIRLGEDAGEQGLDSGGVQQEFFRLAMADALNPKYGAFTIAEYTRMTWFLPSSPEPLWKFELIGMLVSLAVYNGLTLPVTFPKALYGKLLGENVTELHHIADGWPELFTGFTTLLEWDEKNGLVEDTFGSTYEFTTSLFGAPTSREMGMSDPSDPESSWPNFSELGGSYNPDDSVLVTSANRNAYVNDYIHWLTDESVRPQFEAFKTGFFACLDRRSITLFDAETLQSVVEGVQDIDIAELRRVTRYVGWDPSCRAVKDFWSIVKTYNQYKKKRLLEFVTASDRVPVGGMENVQFALQKNGAGDERLPTSYTCYGILLLPEYSNSDIMSKKLERALENSKGFGFA